MTPRRRRFFDARRLRRLGPGLVTGAADDDPSGVATYSQAGAQFGYGMLWTTVLTLPLMVGIQMISARLGFVTGRGLAANIKRTSPPVVLHVLVALLLAANTINIAADVAAMGDALHLLVGGGARLYSVLCGVLCVVLQVFLRYRNYVRYLKWLTLTLLSYVAVAFTVHVDWGGVAVAVVRPRFTLGASAAMMVVAVFGTTISPYLFFWQAAQEMEDRRERRRHAASVLHRAAARRAVVGQLARIRTDTVSGMVFSNVVAFFIMLSTAATLHVVGVTDIRTSADAAEALRPLGGPVTFLLFALGIVGTGLLAVPVLAGSAAYAVAECFGWRAGLDLRWSQARAFYALIGVATSGGVGLGFFAIDPMRALLWSAVLNGVIAVPIMVVMMRLASRHDVMGDWVTPPPLRALGWLATTLMGVTVATMLATL